MEETENQVFFVKVTEATLLKFLKNAKNRIIIAKAGYNDFEIKTILDLVENKGLECTVYVDPGENVVRWGLGKDTALKKLIKNNEKLNVQTVDHIRMSVVIVDDQALVYSPVALSWEDEPKLLSFPNGFIGGSPITESLLEQINATEKFLEPDPATGNLFDQIDSTEKISLKPDQVIPFPGCIIPKKDIKQTTKELSQTIEKLDKNPPVDPSRLRKVTVYRNNYKLLKFQIKGVKIKNKSISLRPFNSLFPDLNQRLKASWRIFTTEDMSQIKEIPIFLKEIDSIIKNYTLNVGRFGYLIRTEDRNKFANDIEMEKKDFLEALNLKPDEELENKESKYFIQSSEQDNSEKQNLGTILQGSREALKKYMNDLIKDNPVVEENIFKNEGTLYGMVKKGKIDKNEALDGVLENFIDHLNFPQAEELIEKMDVTEDYYDVSDELLNESEEFAQLLEKLRKSKDISDGMKLRKLSDAYEESK